MAARHIPRVKDQAQKGSIPSPAQPKYLQKLAEAYQSGGSTDSLQPHVSFRFFNSEKQCVSCWQPDEVKGLFNSLRILCETTWEEVKRTGVKGSGAGNTGLRYKPVDLPKALSLPSYFSEEVQVVEMGCSQKARFFGVREDATFYLIWLDRNHDIFKS